MAAPSNRRPGFSRRAQYGLFLGYVIAVVGVLFAILLLVIAKLDPQGFSAIRGAAIDVTAPASSGGRSVVRMVSGGGESIGNYFMAAAKNAGLSKHAPSSSRTGASRRC
jgi:rod shape-determining protein MreC